MKAPDKIVRLLAGFVLLSGLSACRQNRPEDIGLPYAKKKCPIALQSDSTLGRNPAFSVFRWLLADSGYDAEIALWEKRERDATTAYLDALKWKYAPQPDMRLYWDSLNLNLRPAEKPSLTHRILSAGDSLRLHLFFKEETFGSGVRPTVLLPYDTALGDYGIPPACFFDCGGILAVAGDAYRYTKPDSTDFFLKRDSLYRRIWIDTLNVSARRYVYRLFLQDSALHRDLISMRTLTVKPNIDSRTLLRAVNRLLAEMFTSAEKLAILSKGENAAAADTLIWARPALFRVACLDLRQAEPALQTESTYPALLIRSERAYYPLAACLQEKNTRKCGARPVLLYEDASPEILWKFILYQIAREEKLVTAR